MMRIIQVNQRTRQGPALALWRKEKRETVVPHSRFAKREKGLQATIESGMPFFLGADFVSSEMTTSVGVRIDSIGITEEGRLVIVEYKELESKDIFAQGLDYVDCAIRNPDEFAEHVRFQSKRILDTSIPPLLVLIAKDFSIHQKYAVNRVNDEQEVQFKQYEIFRSEKGLLVALKNCTLPRDFESKGWEKDLRLVKNTEVLENLAPEMPEKHMIEATIRNNLEALINARAGGGPIETDYRCLTSPLHPAIDMSTDRLIVLGFDSVEDYIEQARIKQRWADQNHAKVQRGIEDVEIVWAGGPVMALFSEKYSTRDLLFLDAIEGVDVLPFEYSSFISQDGSSYLLVDRATLPKDLKSKAGSHHYSLADVMKNINPDSDARKALGFLIGEIKDLGNDVEIRYTNSGVSVSCGKKFLEIHPRQNFVSVRLKTRANIADPYQISEKKPDGVRIEVNKKGDVAHTMALVRQAYFAKRRGD